jgi:hypothetical protein
VIIASPARAEAEVPNLAGASSVTFGHSWLTDLGHTPGTAWQELVAGHLGMLPPASHAEGGERAVQTLGRVLNFWSAGDADVVFGDWSLNDTRLFGLAGLEQFRLASTAIVAALTAGSKREAQPSDARAGKWTVATVPLGSHQVALDALRAGPRIALPFRVPAATLFGGGRGGGAGAGAVSVSLDGVPVQRVSLDTGAPPDLYTSIEFHAVPIRVRARSSGAHTVGLTLTRPGAVYVDALLTPASDPPLVVLMADPPILAWGSFPPHDKGSTVASRAYANTLRRATATVSPRALTVDPSPGWDPQAMIGIDGVHPDDAGQAHLAARVGEQIEQGLTVTSSPAHGRLSGPAAAANR